MDFGVPAIRRDVAPAAEGHSVIDDDDLLMMAGPERTWLIKPELDHTLAEPALRPMRIKAL
jgi:5-deoxy-D-glucuronate isomerase